MTKTDINLVVYSKEISFKLRNSRFQKGNFTELKSFPLIPGKQCLYVMDWKHRKLTFARGVKEMLGYADEEFSMDLALNYFHPDDKKFVNRIIKGIIEHSTKNNVSSKDNFLNLTFRLRKKDGTYINVLRKSKAYEIDNKGKLISNLSVLTDISFISNNNKVEWDIYAERLDAVSFKENVYKEFHDFFTKREMEIITLIFKGLKTREISNKLCVSEHTVATHRKNILRKSNCHGVNDLQNFCIKNGIV